MEYILCSEGAWLIHLSSEHETTTSGYSLHAPPPDGWANFNHLWSWMNYQAWLTGCSLQLLLSAPHFGRQFGLSGPGLQDGLNTFLGLRIATLNVESVSVHMYQSMFGCPCMSSSKTPFYLYYTGRRLLSWPHFYSYTYKGIIVVPLPSVERLMALNCYSILRVKVGFDIQLPELY